MTPAPSPVRIATRGSALAMWQAEYIADILRSVQTSRAVEIVVVRTQGDQDQSTNLAAFGGMGVFTREVQHAVLDGRADLAVHSLKDLPTESVPGLSLAGIPARAAREDVLVPARRLGAIRSLSELPQAASVATGSPRRRAQLLHHRTDLRIPELRGNVGTRLQRVEDGHCDATILAKAGLERLGLLADHHLVLDVSEFLPAVGQGALGVECRSDDEETQQLLRNLSDSRTISEVTAERTILAELQAGCHAPLGVRACLQDSGALAVEAVLLSLDGKQRTLVTDAAPAASAAELGTRVARQLRTLHDDQSNSGERSAAGESP